MTNTLQAHQAELAALQTELANLPALLQEAAKRRDVSGVNELKRWMAELPQHIESEKMAIVEAEIAALEEQAKPLSEKYKTATRAAEQAQQARQRAMEACSIAENRRENTWAKWMVNQKEKEQLERELNMMRHFQDAQLTGEPLKVTDAFFSGMAFRPAAPTEVRGDPMWSEPFKEQRQAESKRR
jgi:chromosome segregation ATPase